MAPWATVSDKNAQCKQREKSVDKEENHSRVISSPPKRKELIEISVSK